MYNKQNNGNIWLESMKRAVSEHQSISQIRSKTQAIAAHYDNISDSLMVDKSKRYIYERLLQKCTLNTLNTEAQMCVTC